jgi:ribosomal protein S26
MSSKYGVPNVIDSDVPEYQKNEFEKKIQLKIEELGQDYDLEDLNSNDRLVLRSLAQSMLALDDYEMMSYTLRLSGQVDIDYMDKLNRVLSSLRGDISQCQDDLKITRKVRKTDKEASVLEYLEDLKKKAKEYIEARHQYIYCPQCATLLGTVWVASPDNKKNKISFACNRKLDNGDTCTGSVITTVKELIDNKGTNDTEVMPESMR